MGQPYKLELVTPPATQPISLSEAKLYLRVDNNDEDAEITEMITAENFCGIKFISQHWHLWLDRFPNNTTSAWWDGVREGAIGDLNSTGGPITIPISPVISVASIKTYDDSDVEYATPISDFVVDKLAHFPRIVPRNGKTWPQTVLRPINGVKIELNVGHTTLHEEIKQAIKIILAKIYETRGDSGAEEVTGSMPFTIPPMAAQMLNNHRSYRL
jgi:hypothetical protein